MIENSRQAADPEWKQLLELEEQLANQPSPPAQRDLIIATIGQMLHAKARAWLVSFVYPLPGIPTIETLPDAPATPLAHQAMLENKMQCEPPPAEGEARSAGGPLSVAVPLSVRNDVLGVVQVDRPADNPFSERDLNLLEELVIHSTLAMELTRLEFINEWRSDQLNLVRSVSQKVASFSSLDQLYNQVSQLIQETFQFYYVGILILDESQKVLHFRGSAGKYSSIPFKSDFYIPLGNGITGIVAQSGIELVAPDVRAETHYRFIDGLPETLSEAALPLKIENHILGVLDFQSNEVNAFHEHDMLVLRSLADNIALAIESKRLYASLERRAEQISSVFEVSHALTSILDLDELLDEVVQLIQNRFGYPFVHVYSVHPGRRLVIYQAGTGERSAAMKREDKHYPLDAGQGLISWVARNGRTFLSNDVSQEPLYLAADVPPYDTRAELTVPLAVGGEVLGVLDIQSQSVNAFDQNDRSLFEALAAPVAVAMRNAYLYRSEQWRRKVAESFRDVTHLISTNMPLNQLLDRILKNLESLLPCDGSAVWLVQEEKASQDGLLTVQSGRIRLQLAATYNISAEKIQETMQEQSVRDLLDAALQTEQPLIRRPGDPSGPLGVALGFPPEYSSIAAPMRTNNRPLGILTLAHRQNGRYGSEAQAITATFASYAAVAIQNARLLSESQGQALISTMLLQVAEASQSIKTVEDLLSTMLRLTRLLVGVKKCAFLLWEDSQQTYVLKAWYGFEPSETSARQFSPHLPALTRLSADQTRLYLSDPAAEMAFPEMSLDPTQGRIVMLPLLVRRELIGAYLVGLQVSSEAETKDNFDPKALSILQGVAQQTAMTVDNLNLLEARQEEAYVTAALLQVAQAVVTSNDLNDTLDTIAHLLPILVGIETCVIYLWDANNNLLRPTQVSARTRREEEVILGHAFAPGEHLLLDAIRETGELRMSQIPEPDLPFDAWASLNCQAYEALLEQGASLSGDWVLGYPLLLQNQVFGVLMVREVTASPAFWERRLEIIHGIAQQTSLAIQNDISRQEMVQTERIEREMQLARQIQETFLPDVLPEFKHWELDVRWETAREIGGDFYDIFKMENNRIGLVIADVADKGLPAALYMTVSRTLIRASAANNRSPRKVLEEVNELLVNDSTDSMFITAIYCILSLDTGEMRYANAGHNLPLLYRRKTGQVEQLPKGGMALGIQKELNLVDHSITIRPGDALVLFTDGVTDLLSPEGEFLGEHRLVEMIQAHGKERIQDMLEALDDAFIEFRRGLSPADDITLLAIRREPIQRKRKSATAPAA